MNDRGTSHDALVEENAIMKLRYSILSLLALMAYVALNAAAIHNLQVCAIARWLWWGLMFLTVFEASGRTSGRSVFARGVLFSALLAWSALVFHQAHLYSTLQWIETGVNALAGGAADEDVHHLAIEQAVLAFGLLGGVLSLWRYRILEQRTMACATAALSE
jgi:hypothetical protein